MNNIKCLNKKSDSANIQKKCCFSWLLLILVYDFGRLHKLD